MFPNCKRYTLFEFIFEIGSNSILFLFLLEFQFTQGRLRREANRGTALPPLGTFLAPSHPPGIYLFLVSSI